MVDRTRSAADTLEQVSYRHAAAVTPHDSTNLVDTTKALWIGGAGSGNLSVLMAGGETVDFDGVPVGILPICVQRVNATGTDVTNIVALW